MYHDVDEATLLANASLGRSAVADTLGGVVGSQNQEV